MQRVFEIFKRLLELHILTKTDDKNFHEDSEKAYELAFDVFHKVQEMRQDTEEDEPTEYCDVAIEAYDLVEELKTIVSEEIDSNKDKGMDNLLRTLLEQSNGVCGNMRRYYRDAMEEEEEETPEEETKEEPTSKKLI